MAFTDEQQDIIYSHGNVKCIAVAGSGKSTTLFAYAKYRQFEKGLYLVYNNAARAEAKIKAKKYLLHNLKIHTAHSLAYAAVGKKYRIVRKIPLEGIIGFCDIRGTDEERKYTLAQMILDGVKIRCNKISNTLLHTDFQNYNQDIVKEYFEQVTNAVDFVWDAMDEGRVGIPDDFYLKKYVTEIMCKGLGYDYVVFDEGQDANEVMLHGFKQQPCTKVIVGDPSQQIYGWRGAINALNKVDFATYTLSGAFRFGPEIAAKANHVLLWKKLIGTFKGTALCEGLRTTEAAPGPTAYLCRTTVGLFKKMVEVYVTQGTPMYIEGGLYNNDFLTNNRLLSNIYWLFSNQRAKIRHPLIKSFKHITNLQEFCKNTGNREIGSLIDLIFAYKADTFRLKDEVIKNLVKEKEQADAIFSTVHKAKGQEYTNVVLDDTFMLYDDILKLSEAIKVEYAKNGSVSADLIQQVRRANEEINIRYVAITRGMNGVKL